ncbi:EAL domain-containing protein [Anabaena cylindrica FACHB-243]|uniref:Response regulator receiver modulated diguanylate cyclase/phosphodiesterase n=1 Tax=Anabaena cylindrica (strain ATCC 27899 / PCC 7122) TaxID=272123 RepID=K9ZGW1_ANACC|nr:MULTISPECIES: EAL domain-containing protein [Anabaena]AFZ57994.1 response regulator receiver modulated diguanylate cyclase/phosphodiesterase [Anabaena cylindrica PCC 7122]MBD2420760.1 EAL domain-containing protein [Anabaena cylindrica FACHB-243]MBY5282724.1 EAL domain-containing protein [Anabaena sp. CCAP 1446/1C]MBY5311173.1 EAL domain-containing protein [Anabaena sp. CCAP 1446/1C]MCM2408221.1 EAL domain-containing protein [Anabaena sp. CCAP 1446/1C]
MNKILIVEDDPLMRELIQQILDLEGFSTITAEDGWLGLQMVEQHQPDLIICDVMMPKLDGYSLIQTLRQNPVNSTIPLIFLTAKAERCDLRQAMELGADDYLTKPFEASELLQAIKTQLKKRQAVTQHYINQVQQMETELVYLARHDSLTGLPNQLCLEDKFNKNRLQVYSQQQMLPFLLIDIDIIYPHKLFFESSMQYFLIKILSGRLKDLNLQNNLIDLIAQLKTNQLVILLKPIQEIKTITDIAQQFLDNLLEPLFISNQKVFLQAKIGISCYPNDGLQLSELLTHAEFALEYYQPQDTNLYHFYSREILDNFRQKVILEADLIPALERNEFQLYYQPQINITTGEVVGVEALIRWQHPEYGTISPAEFIPIAEKSGFIIPLGEWVIERACREFKILQSELFNNFNMAINISACQFRTENFSEKIIGIIKKIGIAPESIELELTESVFIQNAELVKQKLDNLSNQGLKISIDDFGTGYSSFKYLQDFSFHSLKIDRYFITNIDQFKNKQALVKSIIQTANNLNLNIVAEGVETKNELDWLMQNNCDVIQGYFFSPPLSIEELKKFLLFKK